MDFFKQYLPLILACIIGILFLGGWYYLFAPPTTFPAGSMVTIARGASAPEVAQELADMDIVKHPSVLRFLFRITGTSGQIHSGIYRFPSPEDVFVIGYSLSTGSYGIPPVRLTLVEGSTVREMATQIATAFPYISEADFSRAAKPYEGYLFPDTYFFSPSADATSIVAAMRENFTGK